MSKSKRAHSKLDLSILIPTYGRGPKLGRLLDGLAKQDLSAKRFEVIVVDDGSPEAVEIDASRYSFAIRLERQENAGPAAARNRGLKLCKAPLVLILNDDALPAPNLLTTHLAAHAEAPVTCAVLGTFHFTEEACRHPFVSLLDQSDLLFAFKQLKNKHNHLFPWQFFWTCNLSLPVKMMREVGGFDEKLFDKAIVEDVELGYRLEKLGLKVLYREDAICHHDHVMTAQDYVSRGVRLGKYLHRMWEKHRDPAVMFVASEQHVHALEASCVDVVPQYQPVLENLVRGLDKLDEEYFGREIPADLRAKGEKLIADLSGASLRRGVHLERTGIDLVELDVQGPPQGRLTSIVIASFNALAKTQRCIRTILAKREAGYPIELIVIDNGSTDGSAEWLAQQSDVKFIRNSENLGAPHARNQGIAVAKGDWIAFFDNDVYVTSEWLSRALYHGEADPEVGAVCLVANRASKMQQVEYQGDSSEQSIEFEATARRADHSRRSIDTHMFTSFGVLVRRNVIETIGGFDETFSPWGFEDDDYSLRLRFAGFRSRVAQDVFVYHDHYHDSAKERRHADLLHRNWEHFVNKWGKGDSLRMYDYQSLGLDMNAKLPLEKLLVPVETVQQEELSESSDSRRNVLILGSGRSGTSMLAGTLASAGWDVGDDPYPGREANPKGFFETAEINGINESLLTNALPEEPDFGHMQRWLAEASLDLEIAPTRAEVKRIEQLVGRSPFAFKDPRFCYTLPAWRESLGEFGVVCVFREPAITAASILKECGAAEYLASVDMSFERAVRVWVSMYKQVLERHRQEGDWLFVHYDQLLTEDGIARLEDFVGGPVAHDFPDTKLRRSVSASPVSEEASSIYAELCSLAGYAAQPLEVESAADRIPAQPSTPKLTVLVCTYQRKETLVGCLDSFCAQTAAPGSFELVIVNDGSTDGTKEYLDEREFDLPVKIVHRENGGLSAARNSGLEHARGELVLLINDDTIATPTLVEAHLATHARHGDRKIAVQGTFEQPIERLDNALMRVLEDEPLVFCYSMMTPGAYYDWNRFWTCNVSVATEAVRAAGAFDEEFRHYGCEDTDLALRLDEAGYEVYYDGTARAMHDHVLSFDDFAKRSRTVARAWVRLFRKHPRALQHEGWNWVLEQDRAGFEHVCDESQETLAAMEKGARELARMDLASLGVLGDDGVALAANIRKQLTELLQVMNQLYWFDGLAQGMRDLELDSLSVLTKSLEPLTLGTEAPLRVLAWPRYDRDEDLQLIGSDYGPALLANDRVCLCLRYDAAQDGPIAEAIARIEGCLGSLFNEGSGLEVLLVDNELGDGDTARLGQAVQCVIGLEAGQERAAFERELRVDVVASANEMESALGSAPVAQLRFAAAS